MGLQNEKVAGFSAGTLKFIALICMLIDHLSVLVPGPYSPIYLLMRLVGRVAAPLFFFFLAEGYRHTRNKNRYTMRLVLFTVVSYLPFILYLRVAEANTLGYLDMSIAYTLLLSFLALRARHEIHNAKLKTLAVCLCVLFSFLGDWGFQVVFAVLLFDYFRDNRCLQQVSFIVLIFLVNIAPMLITFIGSAIEQQPLWSYFYWIAMWLGVLIAMYLIGVYNGERGRQSRSLFYIFYPVHLLVIVFLVAVTRGFS